MWEEEREVRPRSQLGPHHKGPHKSIFFTFVSKDNGKGRGMYGGKILSGVASGATSLSRGLRRRKTGLRKKTRSYVGVLKLKLLWGSQGVGMCPRGRWRIRSGSQKLDPGVIEDKAEDSETREVTLDLGAWRPAVGGLGGDRARKLG